MRRSKHLFLFVALVSVVFAGCKKDDPAQPNAVDHSDYFPVRVGDFRIYDVDSIHYYDVTMTSDTFRFQIMEVVDSTTTVIDGQSYAAIWNEVKIYRRLNESQPWQQTGYAMDGLTSGFDNTVSGNRIKDNFHFIKLRFPVALNKTWKGNAFLTDSTGSIYSPDWDYTYTAVDTTFTHQGMTFDSCAVVTQYDSQNQITRDIEREAYARGIGLVYKYAAHVERQTVDLNNWVPEKGFEVTYRLREHN